MIISIISKISQETFCFFDWKLLSRLSKLHSKRPEEGLSFLSVFFKRYSQIWIHCRGTSDEKTFGTFVKMVFWVFRLFFFEQLHFFGKKMYSSVWFRKPSKNCFDFWRKNFSSDLPKAKIALLVTTGNFWWKIFFFFWKSMIFSIFGNFLLNALFSGYNCPSGLPKCLQRVKKFLGFFGTFSVDCSWPLTTIFWDLW